MSTAAKVALAGNGVISMGGRNVFFRPLNWDQLEALQPQLDTITNMGASSTGDSRVFFTKEQRDAVLDVAVSSIQCNDETVERDWVAKHLTLGNVALVIMAIFTTNGFTTLEEAEEATAPTDSGNAPAAGSSTLIS